MKGTIRTTGTINGAYSSEITIILNGDKVAVTGAVASPTPTPPPPPPPPPTPDTWAGLRIDWDNQISRQQIVNGGGQTKVWQFRTTHSTDYSGRINVAEMTGYEGVMRRVWISTSPSGTAVHARATSEGTSNRVISWSQSARFLSAELPTDTVCYLNIWSQSEDQFYLAMTNNGRG